jgi:hypothetical protein
MTEGRSRSGGWRRPDGIQAEAEVAAAVCEQLVRRRGGKTLHLSYGEGAAPAKAPRRPLVELVQLTLEDPAG